MVVRPENLKNVAIDRFGSSIVRIQIEQGRGWGLNAVQQKLVALPFSKDQKLEVVTYRAVSRLRIVKRPITRIT